MRDCHALKWIMMVSWIPSGRIGFCWPQWMFEVWYVTLSFMSLGHHHCSSPSMAAAAAPILSSSLSRCSAHWPLSSSLAPTLSSAGPACEGLSTTPTLLSVWAQPLFVQISIWGMRCDCAGSEWTDVVFVVSQLVSWHCVQEILHCHAW